MIGFSTGCLYKNFNPLSKESIETTRLTGCKCIELCAGKVKRMSLLELINKKDFAGFDYKSFHLPCDIRYSDNETTRQLFKDVFVFHEQIGFDTIVLHPDLVDDWDFIYKANLPLSFENMDNRKKFGRNIYDMQKVFSRGNFGFVLDLMHAFTNDSSMNLAQELYETFHERISQFHLSGYSAQKGDSSHLPLFITKQKEILTSVPLDKPIIIESVFPICTDKDKKEEINKQLRKELNYINPFIR